MNKKTSPSADLCSKFIGLAIKHQGWYGMMQIRVNSVISTTSADDLLGGSSARGGGIYNLGGSLGGTVTLINSIVQVNTVGTLTVGALQGNGSGIYNDHGTVTLISSSVYANSPPTWAGASLMA